MSALKFTDQHEWMGLEGDDVAVIGITAYAQNALGDLVYIDLPETGRVVKAGEYFAVIESVKAASEIYAPVSGEIIAVNTALKDNVEGVKQPLPAGWIVKIKLSDKGEMAGLMDQAAYDSYIAKLG